MMKLLIPHNNDKGFSLIEVISVFVVIGIVATVVVSRPGRATDWSLSSEASLLKSSLRFAQLKAMNDVSPNTWGVAVSGDRFTLQMNGAVSPVNLPGEDSQTHRFPEGVTAAAGRTVTYNAWGSPGPDSITITLNAGSDSQSVTVTRNTGFIP